MYIDDVFTFELAMGKCHSRRCLQFGGQNLVCAHVSINGLVLKILSGLFSCKPVCVNDDLGALPQTLEGQFRFDGGDAASIVSPLLGVVY